MYLASMLMLGEDDELSDRLYDKYSDIMSTITTNIPALIEKINNRYI
jgi:hypothetical protein